MRTDPPPVRLDELDGHEWRDVVRRVRPDIDDDEFLALLDEAETRKRRRAAH